MWSHQQPHLYENISLLEGDMILNKNFAIVSFLLAHFLVKWIQFTSRNSHYLFRNMAFQRIPATQFHPIIPEFIQSTNRSTRCGRSFGTSVSRKRKYWFTYRMIVNCFFFNEKVDWGISTFETSPTPSRIYSSRNYGKQKKKNNFKRKKGIDFWQMAGSPATNLWTVHPHHLHWQISRRSCYVGWKH